MIDEMGPTPEIEKILLLFDDHYEELYCFLRRYTPPREAEDLCQDVFLELCTDKRFESNQSQRDCLIGIARTMLRRRYQPLQRIHRALIHREDEAEDERQTEEPLPTTTRWLRKVSRELSALPKELQQSVRLVVAEGNSLHDAAQRMGVKSETVEAWTSTGLQLLTNRMCNHDQHA